DALALPLPADRVIDDGVGQGDHRASPMQAGECVEERCGVQVAADLVWRGSDGDVGLPSPRPTGLVATRACRMHEQELVARHHDLADLDRLAIGQRLDEDVDQSELLVVIEHVRQSIGPESDATRERAVIGIRHEVDERMEDRGAGMRDPGRVGAIGAAVEDEAESSSETLDHGWMVGRWSRPHGWLGGTSVVATVSADTGAPAHVPDRTWPESTGSRSALASDP